MSSILEALKKAEQESGGAADHQPPWPSPLPADVAPRTSRFGQLWLLALILVAVAAVATVMLRPFDTAPPVLPAASRIPSSASSDDATGPLPKTVSRRELPVTPTSQTVARPPVATAPALPSQTVSRPKTPAPPAEKRKPPVSSALKSPPLTRPDSPAPARRKVIAPPPEAAEPPVGPESAIEKRLPAAATPPVVPDSQPAVQRKVPATAAAPATREAEKTFRDDPRIELQALVWASDAAQRFVVVNNRLLHEGGSVDGIVVLKIDRDDVLFSEGGTRWYQRFTIR